MRVDLHIHSSASDGELSPAEVVEAAVRGRLDVVSLTDHDTITGISAAQEARAGRPIEIIPGIELSSTRQGRDIHVLGYFIDPSAPSIVEHGRRGTRKREDRIRDMIARLSGRGVELEFADVVAVAGPDRSALGRPHLAEALVRAGHASTVQDAFERLIGDKHPAYLPTELVSPERAIQIILEGGGVPVWAHPPQDLVGPLLHTMVDWGLQGLEVYRPRNRADRVVELERLARRFGLSTSGGSDWHGPRGGADLGDFYVSADEVGALLAAGGV